MPKLFEELSKIEKPEERIKYLASRFFSGSDDNVTRAKRFEQLTGFMVTDQKKMNESEMGRKYKVFASGHFCFGEAGREGLFLGIIHGIMLQKGYTLVDILDAQFGNEDCDAAKEERRIAAEILNCFPDQDPASLTEEQIQEAGDKFSAFFAEGMKGLCHLDLAKELKNVMQRTGVAEMDPIHYSHTPEGMMWTSAILENVSYAVQEFSQQLGKTYDSSAVPVQNSPDSPDRAVRSYFPGLNKVLTEEDYSSFYSMHNFFTTLMMDRTYNRIPEAYAKFNQIANKNTKPYAGNNELLKGASQFQEMTDILLRQNSAIGECQLPVTGRDFFTENSWKAEKTQASDEQAMESLEHLPAYRESHLKLTKNAAVKAAENYVKKTNQGLLRETPETFNRAIGHFLLPGQEPEEVSSRFLRLRAPFTLSPEERKVYLEQQQVLLNTYQNKEEGNGSDAYKELRQFDITREQLKQQIVSNIEDIMSRSTENIPVLKTNDELPDDLRIAVEELPEDGFGDAGQISRLYKDCPDPAKAERLKYERLLDRFEAFEPFVNGAAAGDLEIRKQVKSFQYLQNLKKTDPKGYAEAIAQRYPTAAARARFETKVIMMNAVSERIRGGEPEAFVQEMQLYYSTIAALDQPEPAIYTGRQIALQQRVPALMNMKAQLEHILERKLQPADLEHLAFNPIHDAVRAEAEEAASWETSQVQYLQRHYPEYKDKLHNLEAIAAVYLNTSGTEEAERDNRALLNALSAQNPEARHDLINRAAADLLAADQELFGKMTDAENPVHMIDTLRRNKQVLAIAANVSALLFAAKQENALEPEISRILEDRRAYYSQMSLYEMNLQCYAGEAGWLLMNMKKEDAEKLRKYLLTPDQPDQELKPDNFPAGSPERILASSLLSDARTMFKRNAQIGTEYLNKAQLEKLKNMGGLDLDKHAVNKQGEAVPMLNVPFKRQLNCRFETYRSPDLSRKLDDLSSYRSFIRTDIRAIPWSENVEIENLTNALQQFSASLENAKSGISGCSRQKKEQFRHMLAQVRIAQQLMKGKIDDETDMRALDIGLQSLKNSIYAFRKENGNTADQKLIRSLQDLPDRVLKAADEVIDEACGHLAKHHVETARGRISSAKKKAVNTTVFDPALKLSPEESESYAKSLWYDFATSSESINYFAKINPLSPDDLKRVYVYNEETGKLEQPFVLKNGADAGYPEKNPVPQSELLKKYFNIDYLRSHPVFVYEPGALMPKRLTLTDSKNFTERPQLDDHLPLKFTKMFQALKEQRRKEAGTEAALHMAESFVGIEEEAKRQYRKIYGPERPQPEQVEKKKIKSYVETLLYTKQNKIQNTRPVSGEILKKMTPDQFTALTIAALFTEKASMADREKRFSQITNGEMILSSVVMHRDGYGRQEENDKGYTLALEAADGIVKNDYSKAGEILAEGIRNYVSYARFVSFDVSKVNPQMMGNMLPAVQLLDLLEKNPELKAAAAEKGLKEETITRLHTIANTYNLQRQSCITEISLLKQNGNPQEMKEKIKGLLVNKLILKTFSSQMKRLEDLSNSARFNNNKETHKKVMKLVDQMGLKAGTAEYQKAYSKLGKEFYDIAGAKEREEYESLQIEKNLSDTENLQKLREAVAASPYFKQKIQAELDRLTSVEGMQKYLGSSSYTQFADDDPKTAELLNQEINAIAVEKGPEPVPQPADPPKKKAAEPEQKKPEEREVYKADVNAEAYRTELLRLIRQMQNTDSRMSRMKEEYRQLSEELKNCAAEFRDGEAVTEKKLSDAFHRIAEKCNAYMESHKSQGDLSSRQQKRLKVISRLLDLKQDLEDNCEEPNADMQKALARKTLQNLVIYEQKNQDKCSPEVLVRSKRIQVNRLSYEKNLQKLQKDSVFQLFAKKKEKELPGLLKVNGQKLAAEYVHYNKQYHKVNGGKKITGLQEQLQREADPDLLKL